MIRPSMANVFIFNHFFFGGGALVLLLFYILSSPAEVLHGLDQKFLSSLNRLTKHNLCICVYLIINTN